MRIKMYVTISTVLLLFCCSAKHEKKQLARLSKTEPLVELDSLEGLFSSEYTVFDFSKPFFAMHALGNPIGLDEMLVDSTGWHLKPKWDSVSVTLTFSNNPLSKHTLVDHAGLTPHFKVGKEWAFVNGKPMLIITRIDFAVMAYPSTKLTEPKFQEQVDIPYGKTLKINWQYQEFKSNGKGKLILQPAKPISPFEVKQFFSLCSHPYLQPKAIVVDKQSFDLYYFEAGALVKRVKAGWGQNPDGHKQEQGDNRTPEGEYYITKKVKGPFSGGGSEYLGAAYMELNYPNIIDAKKGFDAKKITQAQYYSIIEANKNKTVVPKTTKLGGAVGLHGWISDFEESGNLLMTYGCVCMLNRHMEWFYNQCPIGTRVYIF